MEWSSFYQDIDNVRACDGALIVTEVSIICLPVLQLYTLKS